MEHFTPKRLAFEVSESKKKNAVFCCAYSCKNKPNEKKRGLCHKHYSIHRRIVDPIYNRYVNFKGNALRRGKVFHISLPEFREWCIKTGYIIQKGKRGRNCSIDRINNNFGYFIWNIQIKSSEANTRKYYEHDKHFTELDESDPDYLPF